MGVYQEKDFGDEHCSPILNAPNIIDGHVDIVYAMEKSGFKGKFSCFGTGPVTLEQIINANVRIIGAALYCPDSMNGENTSAAFLSRLLVYADEHLDGLTIIKDSSAVDSALSGNSDPGAVLLVENCDALLETNLELMAERGIRIAGLTHAGRNRIGDGNAVQNPQSFTGQGRELISRLQEHRFAIDVAHLSEPCFKDLLDCFDGPIFSSHTGFRFFRDTPRNLCEDQLSSLFEREGIVGIAVGAELVSGTSSADIEDVFRHIDWVTQRYGPHRVAIGSDFCGFDGDTRRLESIGQLQSLSDLMTSHGYPPQSVCSIMGLNWASMYHRIFPPA